MCANVLKQRDSALRNNSQCDEVIRESTSIGYCTVRLLVSSAARCVDAVSRDLGASVSRQNAWA
eukprot:5361865-Pleurochrysis_carterae.AAC.2